MASRELLAVLGSAAGNAEAVLRAGAWLAGFVVAFAAAAWIVRRWWKRRVAESAAADMWSLQQLRDLRDSGQITVEEYERLRSTLIGKT